MKKLVFLTIGSISLVLGFAGVFLPVLPTTPFILLSLWCFTKSSGKMYKYVMQNKYLAPYVNDYVSGNGIPRNAKIKAILLIWITIGSSVIFFIDKMILDVMLLLIATVVSLWISFQ